MVDISMKLSTLNVRFITLAHVFLELFPFDYLPYNFVSALYLKKRYIFIETKPDTLINRTTGYVMQKNNNSCLHTLDMHLERGETSVFT